MIVLLPLWRRRWWVEFVLDSDDRLDAARSLYWHAVMNRPNKLVILCKRARVLARSDHPETMPIQVEPGIPTELPAASRRPGPSKTRSAAIHRCGKNGARLRRPQCGRMRRKPWAVFGIQADAHWADIASLPSRQQHAAVELFRGTMVAHSFIADRDDRSHESRPISFAGDSWRDYIPIRLPWTVCIRERLPPGCVAVLINQSHIY